ncbi:site-specific integrase, partial [Pseudomonas gessardii]|nr:site-specific integrase [Pseudomonas gessardii]
MSSRLTGSQVDATIESFVALATDDRESLLQICLSKNAELAVSAGYVIEQTGLSASTVKNKASLFQPILDAMADEGIIVSGHPSGACEWRRRLLAWYEGMPKEQKLAIPVAANTIRYRGYLSDVPELVGFPSARAKYELVRSTFEEILEDLRALGVLDREYQTVVERVASKKPVELTEAGKLKAAFKSLRSVSIYGLSDVMSVEPERPFIHLLHVFSAASMNASSESGQANFIEAFKYFRDYLKVAEFTGLEDLRELVSVYALPKFRVYLQEKIIERVLSTNHCNTLMSSARKMMERALQINGLGLTTFMAAQGFDPERETDQYKPYSAPVRARIAEAILEEIAETNRLAQPYVLSHVGEDPVAPNGKIRRGCATIENARWIFENKLNCKPLG